MVTSPRTDVSVPSILPNILLASCYLENIDFSFPQTSQVDEAIILPFFVFFTTLGFLLSAFFSTLQRQHCFIIKLAFLVKISFLIRQ